CPRTSHRLWVKVSKNTGKFRLAFNQIVLFEPTIQPWEIRAVDDFEKVFAALNKQRPDGLYALGAGGVMRPNQKRIAGFALKSRLPSMGLGRSYADAGGLMSYGRDFAESYRRVAYFVDSILKGAKRADLAVEP